MDLEVVGRHALLFDDDSMAAFVNTADALVEWNSLQIDRYDVRHLLSAPPPRRRNLNLESISADEFLIDQERYLDLPPDSEQPEVEDGDKPSGGDSYHSVAFSYGFADDSADQKNTDGGMESSGYLPPFAIPGNIVQSLPPTEKVHQIIARTAMFVSKHGGQSEIVLRVKQGDNPTFRFLMPDHHLHPYFRYLVEHRELLHTEFDEKSQDERKKAGIEHDNSNSVGGALSLIGSVYGSGEDEAGDAAAANSSPAQDTEKVAPMGNAAKDESVARKPILLNKENILAVKKNSSVIASKPKSVKGIKKEGDTGLLSAAEEKSKSDEIGVTSQHMVEPPPEMKRLIDKLVEFVMRNGKQFEATLLEQDSKHDRFPFLLPSNQYHPYYLRALQANQESKVNGKSFNSGKDDPRSRRINKKALTNDLSHSTSDFGDVPFESDRKEKFKMVIGKSKKDGHELERGTEDSVVTVDAAAAAAILDAATRGIKHSDSHNHLNRSEGGQSVGGADSSDANLTEEQRRKAERLKRAKMFVAMLKSGAVPTKAGTSRDPSVEPQEPGVSSPAHEVNHNNIEREGISVAEAVNKLGGMGNLGGKQSERLMKRKYRSKLGGCEDDEEGKREDHLRRKYRSRSRRDEDVEGEMECKRRKGNGRRGSHSSEEDKSAGESSEEERNNEKHDEHRSKRKHRSRSRRDEDDDEVRNAVEKERRRRKRRHRSRSSEESGSKEEIGESDREHKHYKKSHHEKRSRRRHGVERCKKHRTHRSSHDKHCHRNPHSSRDESKAHHKHEASLALPGKEDELEEGEVSSRVLEESRGITGNGGERGTSVDVVSSQRQATSQPSDTTEIPADLRAKIRAMLMVTRS